MDKIIVVSNTAFSLYNFRRGILRALRDKGYEVITAATKDSYSEKLEKEGFKFISITALNRKGKNPIEDIRLLFELYENYKKESPSLVLHFTVKPNIYGSIAAKMLGIKSISSITGLGYLFMNQNLINILGMLLYKVALSFPLLVAFQNRDDRDLFVSKKLVDERKTFITPGSGVDISFYSEKYNIDGKQDEKKVVFLLIARMLWDKGINEFIEASQIVKIKYYDTEFCLLGDIDLGNPSGIPQKIIEEWVNKGLIKYHGFAEDVRPFIIDADIIVLPSFYREGIPRSLLEAMAMGKPIITTDIVGCRETIENGENGFIVPAKNSRELASAMMKMIEMGFEKRKAMGENGRQKVLREFDERIVIKTYLETIEFAIQS